MMATQHPKQFQAEAHALANTPEFHAIVSFVETMKKKGPSPQIKEFHDKYMAQIHRVMKAHHILEKTMKKKVTGKNPHHKGTITVNDDAWIHFNKEYYKLREMEYYAGYKIPEMVALRAKIRALVETDEMDTLQDHWHTVTQTDQHQLVVKHEAELVMAIHKAIHLSKEDEKWLSPSHSPVMFDAWHIVYCYFKAVADGDMEPLFDFMIDGKYADEYVEHVDPKFPAPENYPHDLYLF
jgi:hypothetical protein